MAGSVRETVPAWRGDWQERIAQRLKEQGFESYSAFLEANPGVTYTEMAQLLSAGEDVVPVQLERLHASSVRPEQREQAVLDSLARFLREALKKGWGVGHRWHSSVGAALTSWNVTWGGGTEIEKLERALFELKPPDGWIPEPKDDPVLLKAAAAVWQRR